MKYFLPLLICLMIRGTIIAQSNVVLDSPPNYYQFRKGEVLKVSYGPASFQRGQVTDYRITIKLVEPGQTYEEAYSENDTLIYKERLGITSSGYQGEYFSISRSFDQRHFVWKVSMTVHYDGVTNYYVSDLGIFATPQVVEEFYAGNTRVYLDTASSDIEDFWGRGHVLAMLRDSQEDLVPVEFEDVVLKESSGMYFIETGYEIPVDTSIEITLPDYFDTDLEDAVYDINRFILNSAGVRAEGMISKDLSHFGINSTISATGRCSYNKRRLFGAMPIDTNVTFNISNHGLQMTIDTLTRFLIQQRDGHMIDFHGYLQSDHLLRIQDSSKATLFWTSTGAIGDYLDNISSKEDTIALAEVFDTNLRLGSSALLDLSDTISYDSTPDNWQGVLFKMVYLIQDNKLILIDSAGLFNVDSAGYNFQFGYELPEAKLAKSYPYTYQLDSVFYLIKGSKMKKGSYGYGSVSIPPYSSQEVPFWFSLEGDSVAKFPEIVLSEDTFLFTPPYAMEPTNIYGDSVTLSWYAMGESVEYELDVSKDTFKTFAHDYESFRVADTTVQLVGLDPLTNYQYRLRAYDQDGVVSESAEKLRLNFTTGEEIEEEVVVLNQKSGNYRVYPNPVEDVLFIQLPENLKSAEISVYDISGKLAAKTSGQSGVNELNVSHLKKGLHTVKLILNEKELKTEKIIIR